MGDFGLKNWENSSAGMVISSLVFRIFIGKGLWKNDAQKCHFWKETSAERKQKKEAVFLRTASQCL